jgi:coenzyme F420-0:L-glutamate ligase/coenzyme F420-1:gamma-L-glutamate ligase
VTLTGISVDAVQWPEITVGDDLGRRIASIADLRDGDIVVLTSKVVSKAAGRVVTGARGDWIAAETSRVVAQRGDTVIAKTRHGLVLAAAGVDASNTRPGTVVLLPANPDEAARELRKRVDSAAGCNVAVVITDTAGRAWRVGQTDIAIGCAGLQPVADLRGTADGFGRRLDVTMPAIADEVAAAGDLVKGKATGCPVAVLRGLAAAVLPRGESGPGAAALVRDRDSDLFGLGTREAATAAVLRSDVEAVRCFPTLSPGDDVPFEAVESKGQTLVSVGVRRSGPTEDPTWLVQVDVRAPGDPTGWFAAGQVLERTRGLAAAHRLVGTEAPGLAHSRRGWRTVDCTQWRVA